MQTFLLPPEARERPVQSVAAFLLRALPGKQLLVTVAQMRKRRSDEQNRYLWGVVYRTLADTTGQPTDDWHEYFLGEHFGWETVEFFGRRRIRPIRRSSKLSPGEFADFVTFIQARAAEHGVYIPDPNEA